MLRRNNSFGTGWRPLCALYFTLKGIHVHYFGGSCTNDRRTYTQNREIKILNIMFLLRIVRRWNQTGITNIESFLRYYTKFIRTKTCRRSRYCQRRSVQIPQPLMGTRHLDVYSAIPKTSCICLQSPTPTSVVCARQHACTH